MENRDVLIGLNLLVVVGQVVEDWVVVGVEDEPGHGAHLGEDISGTGVVLEQRSNSI